jgi:hypothetical protein
MTAVMGMSINEHEETEETEISESCSRDGCYESCNSHYSPFSLLSPVDSYLCVFLCLCVAILVRLSQPRVGRVLQAFADEVVCEDGEEDRGAGEGDQPPHLQVGPSSIQQGSPTWIGR